MRLDVYQEETAQIARYQSEVLADARKKLASGEALSRLEQNGVLHALQVLVEYAIGKAKHLLKAAGQEIPISAYDTFVSLAAIEQIQSEQLDDWNRAVGLRNRIVHDYMNIRMNVVLELVRDKQYYFIVEFLLRPITQTK
ncbi:MAG: DUF86 domain-containing protein [Methylococcaceae bacterium]|nr:DUF86 domain-containing protein [Methylococcaceae bacterium]